MINAYELNTLTYNPQLCIGCGKCSIVCPHGVFLQNGSKAELADSNKCMECGACQRNCPTRAIAVDNGVGCAAVMIFDALRRKKDAYAIA